MIMDNVYSTRVTDQYISYGFSLRGKSHKKSGDPLQDFHALSELPGGWFLAVVADGVGSEPHSDVGSQLAVESFVEFITSRWGYFRDKDSILNLMKSGFLYAAGKMMMKASQDKNIINEYSTTLHATIMAHNIIYYAHAGDGGIIALSEQGELVLVTEPLKAEDGECVIPLLAGPDYWQFGSADVPVNGVLLCTDGVYDKVAGMMLRHQPCKMDRALVSYFLNPWSFDFEADPSHTVEKVAKVFSDAEPNDFYPHIVASIAQGGDDEKAGEMVVRYIFDNDRPLETCKGINDDITVAVIRSRCRFPEKQPLEYYMPPDWSSITKNVYSILYGSHSEKQGDDDSI